VRLYSETIYRLHGISGLPDGATEIDVAKLSSPTLHALLTTDIEQYLVRLDTVRAIRKLLLTGGLKEPLKDRFEAEITSFKEARTTEEAKGVFLVLKGEAEIPTPSFKARHDTAPSAFPSMTYRNEMFAKGLRR